MKIFRYLTPLVFLILIAIIFWEIPRLIIIKKINCISQFGPCPEEFLAQVQDSQGKNLSNVRNLIKKKIKEDNMILDSMLQYKIPETVLINIVLRKPKFALKINNTYALVDKEGLIISLGKSTNLPSISVNDNSAKIGERISDENLFALKILGDLNFLYQVQSGEIKNNSLVVELAAGQTVIFPLEGDRAVLIGSLRLILGSQVNTKTIDLRFKNPVVK